MNSTTNNNWLPSRRMCLLLLMRMILEIPFLVLKPSLKLMPLPPRLTLDFVGRTTSDVVGIGVEHCVKCILPSAQVLRVRFCSGTF